MPLLSFSGAAPVLESKQAKLAVQIDADNAQPSIIGALLDEVSKYGVANIKRIYGDWTSTKLRSWKEASLEYALHPIQQYSYTVGKNATDSALIIDSMDLLYTEKLDGFCIVSSDSDYTRLASRIRESGLTVYGFGEKKTPKAFVTACDKFIYTEILRSGEDAEDENPVAAGVKKLDFKGDKRLLKLLHDSVDDIADESGWAYLGSVRQKINNRSSEFDPRNYGFRKLSDLFRAVPQFQLEERRQENGSGNQVYIRWQKKA
jgi:uncharacterized LabA/DUF88 family protein